MTQWIAVFIGGGFGSISRFGVSKLMQQYYSGNLPVATFISNIAATIILAVLVYYFTEKEILNTPAKAFLITGFCGGFSTFSTFSYETFELFKNDQPLWAMLNVVFSVAIALLTIYLLQRSFH